MSDIENQLVLMNENLFAIARALENIAISATQTPLKRCPVCLGKGHNDPIERQIHVVCIKCNGKGVV